MSSTSNPRALLVAATLLAATGCARSMTSYSSSSGPVATPTAGLAPTELLLDAELSLQACGSGRAGIEGSARMKVRDTYDASAASELEYELTIENRDRLPLAEAVLALASVGSPTNDGDVVVLWSGQVSDKARLRMRGIIALPRGVSTTEVATALRERRGALQVRVADQRARLLAAGISATKADISR